MAKLEVEAAIILRLSYITDPHIPKKINGSVIISLNPYFMTYNALFLLYDWVSLVSDCCNYWACFFSFITSFMFDTTNIRDRTNIMPMKQKRTLELKIGKLVEFNNNNPYADKYAKLIVLEFIILAIP